MRGCFRRMDLLTKLAKRNQGRMALFCRLIKFRREIEQIFQKKIIDSFLKI